MLLRAPAVLRSFRAKRQAAQLGWGLRRNGTESLHKECLGPEIQSFLPHRGRQESWGVRTVGFWHQMRQSRRPVDLQFDQIAPKANVKSTAARAVLLCEESQPMIRIIL
jgi:hypothetical protein